MAQVKEPKKLELPASFLGNEENKLLALPVQRVLFYAIWKYNEKTATSRFTKGDLEKQFGVKFENFEFIKASIKPLRFLGYEELDEERQYYRFENVFRGVEFNNGTFELRFNPSFTPQIKNTKQQFLEYGLTIVSEFQCKYTYLLYTYLKEKMWDVRRSVKEFSLEEFRGLFKLDFDEYKDNKDFKVRVWQKAMNEINEYSGYKITIDVEGRGKNSTYIVSIQSQEQLISSNVKSNEERWANVMTKKKEPTDTPKRKYRREEPVPQYQEQEVAEVDMDELKQRLESIKAKRKM